MNIRCLLFDCLRQNSVDQTDNRRVVVGIHQIADVGEFLHQSRQIDIRGQVLGHLCRLVLSTLVGHAESLTKLIFIEWLKRENLPHVASHLEQNVSGQRRNIMKGQRGAGALEQHIAALRKRKRQSRR